VVAAPFYAIATALLALVGCLVLGIAAARRHRWGWVASQTVVALLLGVAVADLLHRHDTVTFGLLVVVAPLVVYGLWAGPAQHQTPVEAGSSAMRGVLTLTSLYLLLAVAGGLVPAGPLNLGPLVVVATLLGAVAWGVSLRDAARTHRWGWAAGMVVVTALLIMLTQGHTPSEKLVPLLGQLSLPPDPWFVWSAPFIVGALSYGL